MLMIASGISELCNFTGWYISGLGKINCQLSVTAIIFGQSESFGQQLWSIPLIWSWSTCAITQMDHPFRQCYDYSRINDLSVVFLAIVIAYYLWQIMLTNFKYITVWTYLFARNGLFSISMVMLDMGDSELTLNIPGSIRGLLPGGFELAEVFVWGFFCTDCRRQISRSPFLVWGLMSDEWIELFTPVS